MSYYLRMITEAFEVILKYVAPGQENIVIQNICKKLSFASNDSEENLTQWSLSTAKWHDKPASNFVSICTLTHKGIITEISKRTDCA